MAITKLNREKLSLVYWMNDRQVIKGSLIAFYRLGIKEYKNSF